MLLQEIFNTDINNEKRLVIKLNDNFGLLNPGLFFYLSGGTITGQTTFTQGLVANTITAQTIFSGSSTLEYIIKQLVLSENSSVINVGASQEIFENYSTVNNTGGTIYLTLPDASIIVGKKFFIKNSGSGTVTLNTTSSQTIDGATSVEINNPQSLTVQSDGSNWIII